MGLSGLESRYDLISLPIFLIYATSIAGNITILFIIRTESSLHQPMYYFLSMLAFTDLGLSTTTLPTMFSVFWFHVQEISFNACLVQMYCIHVFSIIESAVLLAMAFDRFIAIREPLRYAAILTNDVIIGIGLAIAGRALALVFPASFLLKKLQYHDVNILSYPFCLHQDLIKTPVSNRQVSSIYGLMVVICSMGLDSVLLLLSYVLILGTVLSIASKAERVRALNTCISHICAVLTFYTPMIGLSMIHRYGQNASPIVHVLMANVYLLVPPLMNPIVYSVKTKQIRDRILKKFKKHEA